ncbi:hypothetical protein ACMGD3_15720 [Lysinibacillus sphaericus]
MTNKINIERHQLEIIDQMVPEDQLVRKKEAASDFNNLSFEVSL